MIAPWLVLIPLIALLLLAAGWDLASFTIPNFIQLGLILAFAAFVLTVGLPLSTLGSHLLAGLLGLVFGFTLFALGYIGGGDAKLLACISLWLGVTQDLAVYVLIACVFGGALSLGLLAVRKLPLPGPLARQPWLLRLHDPKEGVPYGVALAAGLFFILPQTEVFRLAASQA